MIPAISASLPFELAAHASFRLHFRTHHADRKQRHSPEDQAVLEAEYRRNPKPDKAARLEIAKRVALGEREVQVCSTRLRVVCDAC